MEEHSINFFCEEIDFKLDDENLYRNWILNILQKENRKLDFLNFIFCSNEYLLQINKQYLAHDYYTDIITFDQSESEDFIAGDIYISLEYASGYSKIQKISLIEEVRRLLAHGVLHLIGYNDLEEKEKGQMNKMEDYCLSLWPNIN